MSFCLPDRTRLRIRTRDRKRKEKDTDAAGVAKSFPVNILDTRLIRTRDLTHSRTCPVQNNGQSKPITKVDPGTVPAESRSDNATRELNRGIFQ